MTHDELIEKIWDQDGDSEAHQNALLAITKLHKPVDNEIERIFPDTIFPGKICVPCVNLYPCRTIRVIEEALHESSL
jgi:hypothetical protein